MFSLQNWFVSYYQGQVAFYHGLRKTSIPLVYATEQFRKPITSEAKKKQSCCRAVGNAAVFVG